MARGRRRGPSLLIPMIVLILATLGVSYWATALYEELEIERQTLDNAQVQIYEVQVAEDEVKIRAEHATEYLGFRGEGALSNPHAIGARLRQLESREYDYYDISADAGLGRSEAQRRALGTGEGRRIGTRHHLVDLIHRQDDTINELLAANRNLLLAIRNQQRQADEAFFSSRETVDARKTERDREIAQLIGDVNNPQPGSLMHAIRGMEDRKQEIAQADEEMLDLYRNLWTSQTRDAISDLREQRRRVQQLREEISAEVEELERALAETMPVRAATEHYDGEIWFVDMERRWAYINLGQRDNVKPGMSFEVQRLQRAERPVPIGMVTVRQVIGDFMSWCEITLLQDDDVPMQVGDKVLSRNFARDLRPRFALVGQFGGAYSRFSRHETEQMLRNEGYEVDTVISRHTDVIVLGVNFLEDSQFKRIDDGDLEDFSHTYQFWRPAEVYYMLGFED